MFKFFGDWLFVEIYVIEYYVCLDFIFIKIWKGYVIKYKFRVSN